LPTTGKEEDAQITQPTDILLNMFVGLVAAFVGVILGTYYERRRVRAERSYDVKLEAYSRILWKVEQMTILAEEIGRIRLIDYTKKGRDPWGYIGEVGGSLIFESAETRQGIEKLIESIYEAQTKEEKLERVLSLMETIREKNAYRIVQLNQETFGSSVQLKLVHVPRHIIGSINEVSKYTIAQIHPKSSKTSGKILPKPYSKKEHVKWKLSMMNAQRTMVRDMQRDLEGTL
jgi:uncharacterized membrane protein